MNFSHIVHLKEIDDVADANKKLELGWLLINVCSREKRMTYDTYRNEIYYIFGLTEEQYEVL
ncbi:hypothetical protein HB837_15385 [Listeria innocua]|uniref:hypothetical protein n=1 Tax=Listeria innocua TaxID=1642 RepID=UPI001625B821|nr:hypothetical protein [Listeria innocua]MBC1353793.1 hypothetical protein [Listeria innocua]